MHKGKEMKTRTTCLLLVACLLVSFTELFAESILLTPDDIDIPYQVESLGYPVMDCNTIVVHIVMHGIDNPELQNVSGLYVKNIITNESFLIAEPDVERDIDKYDPAISGQYIVWKQVEGTTNIFGYDLLTQTEFPITNVGESRSAPDIDGNIVVWLEDRGTHTIYGYDLIAKEEFVIYSQDVYSGSTPKIHGNIVVWSGATNDTDIYGYDLETNEIIPICVKPASQLHPDVYGDIVVWQDNRNNGQYDIYGYNLETQEEFRISSSASKQRYPVIYGNYVAWQDSNKHPLGSNWDIFLYDLVSETEWPIAITPEESVGLSISSSQLLWIEIPFSPDPYKLWTHEFKPNSEIITATEIKLNETILGSNINALGPDITRDGYKDDKDVWYFFIAPESRRYAIRTKNSTFDPTLAIFDEDLVEIDFADNPFKPDSGIVLRANAGTKYLIRIAGYNSQEGTFDLSVKKFWYHRRTDLNFDNITNILDLQLFANEWLDGSGN